MRNRRDMTTTLKYEGQNEADLRSRRIGLRGWMLLGAGAIGLVGAAAKWAAAARRTQARVPQRLELSPTDMSPGNHLTPAMASQQTNPAAVSAAAKPVQNTPALSSSGMDSPAVSTEPEKQQTTGASHKRGKMSAEFDQALEANTALSANFSEELPADGREGERFYQRMEAKEKKGKGKRNAMSSVQQPGSPPAPSAPIDTFTAVMPQSVSAQAESGPEENTLMESKMAVGEELRDREFPVPPPETRAAAQNRVVDQETMSDQGPRMGGALGARPGDRQNIGTAGDILDQAAKTPDLAQQR